MRLGVPVSLTLDRVNFVLLASVSWCPPVRSALGFRSLTAECEHFDCLGALLARYDALVKGDGSR